VVASAYGISSDEAQDALHDALDVSDEEEEEMLEEKRRRYIRDPNEAPDDANIQEGARGGMYYETKEEDEMDEDDDRIEDMVKAGVQRATLPDRFRKGRRYIRDPSEAPDDAEIQEGPRGGTYYETDEPGVTDTPGSDGPYSGETIGGDDEGLESYRDYVNENIGERFQAGGELTQQLEDKVQHVKEMDGTDADSVNDYMRMAIQTTLAEEVEYMERRGQVPEAVDSEAYEMQYEAIRPLVDEAMETYRVDELDPMFDPGRPDEDRGRRRQRMSRMDKAVENAVRDVFRDDSTR
jgi:hypothetical protein